MPRAKTVEFVEREGVTEIDGQDPSLFPELDQANPEQKELLRRARAFKKFKVARDEELKDNKEKLDGLMDDVLEQMHECDIKAFRAEGVIYTIDPGKEKVKIKIDTKKDDGDEDEE